MVAQVVRSLPPMRDPNLLVGADKLSDAGVYRLADDLAIVQTTDFFPPVVDDPYTYGRIAAANALGDLYAMGATPRTALNIVGFPDDELGLDILERILKGGAERVLAAGAVTIGGHSVRDREIKYGLAVTGTVHPDRMMTNAGARPGDALILPEPLGTGLIATANRGSRCPSEALEAACASMVALNAAPARAESQPAKPNVLLLAFPLQIGLGLLTLSFLLPLAAPLFASWADTYLELIRTGLENLQPAGTEGGL